MRHRGETKQDPRATGDEEPVKIFNHRAYRVLPGHGEGEGGQQVQQPRGQVVRFMDTHRPYRLGAGGTGVWHLVMQVTDTQGSLRSPGTFSVHYTGGS